MRPLATAIIVACVLGILMNFVFEQGFNAGCKQAGGEFSRAKNECIFTKEPK